MTAIEPTALRQFIYRDILAKGLPPRSERIAREFGVDRQVALHSIAALRIGKTVLKHPATGEIWMAGPFASEPGTYRVEGDGAIWWGNCAWDMLGVAAIVGKPVRLKAECWDCDVPFEMAFDPRGQLDSDWVVHFLLPARKWYDDVGFT